MKLYKLFMKYKLCVIGILIIVIIYNSTQPIVENMSKEQKEKKLEQEARSLKNIDAILKMVEQEIDRAKRSGREKVTVNASRKKKILKALDEIEKALNNSIVKSIFRNDAKDVSGYYQKIASQLFGKNGAALDTALDRIKMIRKALKKSSSSGSSSTKSTKKKKSGGWV
jgi:RecA/RadA recombinase